ncbi:trigger factor [Nibrella saemangeumensis]|uniref:Trigger factor n=1 Tax=Nibrella saemangeumensis TaxID=1084526 RepID=A0ABP8N0A1_9BACT
MIQSFYHSIIFLFKTDTIVDIALEKASETNASLKIKLTPEDYKPEVDKKLKDYGRKVAMKGFRPGKVPASLIQKMYGKSILVDEINNLLSRTVSSYIRDNKLQVVGDPIPNREQADAIDWDNQSEFEFKYDLGLASDFEVYFDQLPAVPNYQIEAGDKELNETIENLQNQFHGHEHAEEAAEGDMLYGELTQERAEGEPFSTKTALPLNKVAEDALPQFIGKKKGDTLTFDIQAAFPDEKDRALATGVKGEEAAELQGEFTFTVEDITRNKPGELNQEFFDKVLGAGNVENEEQFRTKVQEIIGGNYEREANTLLRFTIEKTLLENIPITLPDEFLKQWLLEVNEGKFTPEQVEEQYDDFTRSVKLQLIKNKIAEQADIKVDFEEVMGVTRQMVREQFGFYGDDSQMSETIDRIARNYLMDDKNNGQNYTNMFNRVYDDKVIEYAKTQLDIQPQTVTLEEFKELAAANNNR